MQPLLSGTAITAVFLLSLADRASALGRSSSPAAASAGGHPFWNLRSGASSLQTPNAENSAAAQAVRKQQHDEEVLCAEFLVQHLPDRDKGAIASVFLNRNIELALQARRANSWAEAVPLEVFLKYVLPYASLTERREGWRRLFFQELAPQAAEAGSLADATHKLNQYIWGRWRIRLKADQQPDVMAPSEVIAAGYASPTSLSVFLVNALRSVGIPARVVGTMQWRMAGGGSHSWVEAWDQGKWSFVDPGEYRPLNDTWFYPYPAQLQVPSSPRHAIIAATYEQGGHGYFPLPHAPKNQIVPGIDVTRHYL